LTVRKSVMQEEPMDIGCPHAIDDHIRMALREDMPSGDVTALAVVPEGCVASVDLVCKQDGVIAGLSVFSRTFELLDPSVCIDFNVLDGDEVVVGQRLATLRGDARALLSGERTALNYLQRMSGIATYTRSVSRAFEGTKTRLLDTRKTTPGMRCFEKYAVRIGGGMSHRFGLSGGVMLKDNHIAAAGGIAQAVAAARERASFVFRIEVEVETLSQVREALEAGADVIMLDNMSIEQMAKALAMIDGKAKVECSGNVTFDRVKDLVHLGVDYVPCGALTHSAGILDLSMKGFRVLDCPSASSSRRAPFC